MRLNHIRGYDYSSPFIDSFHFAVASVTEDFLLHVDTVTTKNTVPHVTGSLTKSVLAYLTYCSVLEWKGLSRYAQLCTSCLSRVLPTLFHLDVFLERIYLELANSTRQSAPDEWPVLRMRTANAIH